MFFNSHVESDKHQQREFDSVRTYIRRITKEVLDDKKRKMNGNTSLKIQLHRKLSRVLLSFVSYSVFLYYIRLNRRLCINVTELRAIQIVDLWK